MKKNTKELKEYTQEEALDLVLGPRGTDRREHYEEEVHNFLVGEAIRKVRTEKGLTQEQL